MIRRGVPRSSGGSSGGGDTSSEAAEPIPFQRDAGTLALWHLDEGLGQTASITNIFLGGNRAGGQTVDGEIDEVRLRSGG